MRVRLAAAAALLTLATLLAGCFGATQGTTSDTGSTTSEPAEGRFDGEAAWRAAWRLTERVAPDGATTPRARHPGSPGHDEAARELRDAMAVEGWSFAWQNFTGADYEALQKGSVQAYIDGKECSAAERERVHGLPFANLVATKPGVTVAGTSAAPPVLVLAAHWESKANASADKDPSRRGLPMPGANDGASGVGVLLQLMRHVAATDFPFTLQVVLFDGEDGFEECHPLAGSTWFVHASGSTVDRMVLLDMVGDPAATFYKEGFSHACDPALQDLLWTKARAQGLAQFVNETRGVSDDTTPFHEAGIPAVDVIGFGSTGFFLPYWHTTDDTMAHLDAAFMGHVGDALVATLHDPSLEAAWPATCSTKAG